jgi:hypothetical protein
MTEIKGALSGAEGKTGEHGWIRKVSPEMVSPSLDDNTADVERLIKGLKRGLDAELVNS